MVRTIKSKYNLELVNNLEYCLSEMYNLQKHNIRNNLVHIANHK